MNKQAKIVYNISNKTENEIVKDNTGLVIFLADRFRPKGLPHQQWEHLREDYIQVGHLGLLKAIRAYDPKRSKSLTTSAWVCIWREILRYIQQEYRHKYTCLTTDISIINPDTLWETLPASLSTIDYQVLKYRCEGCTYKEIGLKLGKSKSWVNQKLKAAIEKIKKTNAT